MKTIRINPLSTASRENAIAQIEALQDKLHKLERFDEYLKTLAEKGVATAISRFSVADMFNINGVGEYGLKNAHVSSRMTDNGFVIEANGSQVLFMEFGAGVYYEGWQSYPDERPAGIASIGNSPREGKGMGNRQAWGYYRNGDKSKENLVITHGVPALAGMYYAKKQIMLEVEKKVKELLND